MKRKSGTTLIGLVVGTMGLCLTLFGQAASPHLKQELAAQHFSGVLDGDVHFTNLGILPCGNKHLRVIYYSWNETNPPGFAVRIILMNGRTYIGSYSVAYEPEIHGNVLQFPHSDYGDTIMCGKEGMLPKNAWLDGELNPLFK